MKTVRALYMVLATVILLPIITTVMVATAGLAIGWGIRERNLRFVVRTWVGLLQRGIYDNLDFIKNGF